MVLKIGSDIVEFICGFRMVSSLLDNLLNTFDLDALDIVREWRRADDLS